MFDYLQHEYNPAPRLIAGGCARPEHMLVRDLPLTTSIVVDLPHDTAALKKRHSSKYWSTLRRKKRRFEEQFGELRFTFAYDRDELDSLLPQVQRLFAERWKDEYVSLPWKSARGFAPYADAMRQLGPGGRGLIAAAVGDGKMLAFAYCLIEDECCYFFQHAADRDPKYARFSIGKLLVTELLLHLVEQGSCRRLDFMLGDDPYKTEWGTDEQTVYVRISEPATSVGRVRLAFRVQWSRLAIYLRHGNPRLRSMLKRALTRLDRIRATVVTQPEVGH